MIKKFKPSEEKIKDLDAIEGVRQRIPIFNEPMLYLQITGRPGSPVISWLFRYRTKDDKLINHTIGRWPQMSWTAVRKEVKRIRGEASKGARLDPTRKEKQASRLRMKAEALAPTAAPEDATPTVKKVAEEFWEKHVLVKNKPSHQRNQRWMLDKHVLPKLGTLKITELTTQVATKFLDSLSSTPTQANRVKALLSKMANWAGRRFEELEGTVNPVRGHERHEETPRERRMTVDEIRKLGEAYRQTREPLQTAAIFLLLTGAREGVVLHMKSEHQFPEEGVLRFPPGLPGLKGCRTVYLGRVAKDLLDDLPQAILRRSLWRSWTKLRIKAGIAPTKAEPKGGVSLHDLRRTFASIGVDLGHDEAVVDALLGHSRGRIRDTYHVRADATLAAVAEEICRHLAELLGLAETEVPIKAVNS